jgi:hypothetical protein
MNCSFPGAMDACVLHEASQAQGILHCAKGRFCVGYQPGSIGTTRAADTYEFFN